MDKRVIFILGVILILAISIAMSFSEFRFDDLEYSPSSFTHTKAICNAANECIDVLIECKDGKVENIEPVSDLMKFDENWEDFREDSELC